MVDIDTLFDFSTQELRDFIKNKISFTNDGMVGFLATTVFDEITKKRS